MKRTWPIVVVALPIVVAAIVYWRYERAVPRTAPAASRSTAVAANTSSAAPVSPNPPIPTPPSADASAEQPAPQPPATEQPEPAQPVTPAQPVAQCLGSTPTPATPFAASVADASYCEIGHLVPGSGSGETDAVDWAPSMRFPLDQAPAYANSQVWGVGGTSGPLGGQGDARNYSYPWHDNFCEMRGYVTIMCPSGKGHQGQDIRPARCCDAHGQLLQDTFVVDAVEDGYISSIGTYTVYLVGDSGRLYRYLHMDMKKLKVRAGDRVTRGEAIGYVSNAFGSSVTTFHLHFEIKAPVNRNGTTVYTWVSPYPGLVASYANLLAGHP